MACTHKILKEFSSFSTKCSILVLLLNWDTITLPAPFAGGVLSRRQPVYQKSEEGGREEGKLTIAMFRQGLIWRGL